MDLALFDFDGTITTKGTYPGFLRFALSRRRRILGGLILGPLIVGYRCGLVSDRVIRTPMSRVAFWRDEPDRIRKVGQRYAEEVLPSLVRPSALERIAWHKARGRTEGIFVGKRCVKCQPQPARPEEVTAACERVKT